MLHGKWRELMLPYTDSDLRWLGLLLESAGP